jgi:polysaccharide export outer membrane protein
MSAQHANLFDALAAAGDLPHSAKRFDVRLYRDYNGKRTISQFDLRKSSVLEDPEIFLMRPNDVIYVKPRSNSLFKEESGVFLSVFSILLTAMTLGFTIKNSTK